MGDFIRPDKLCRSRKVFLPGEIDFSSSEAGQSDVDLIPINRKVRVGISLVSIVKVAVVSFNQLPLWILRKVIINIT